MATSSARGAREYNYNDDFTEGSEDHDILLPGLDAQPAAASWRGGADWLLPGGVGRSVGCSSDEDDGSDVSSALSNDGGGEADADPDGDGDGGTSRQLDEYASVGSSNPSVHTPSSADMHGHETTWVLHIVPATSVAVRAAVGESLFGQAAFGGRADGGAGGGNTGAGPLGIHHQLRLLPTTALRSSPFGPFGSHSLQRGDSIGLSQQHPLTLAVQHHHQHQQRFPPSSQRADASAAGSGAGADGRGAAAADRGDSSNVGGAGPGAGGTAASQWSFLGTDPFAPSHSLLSSSTSSSSSSEASSRTGSPVRHQAGGGQYAAAAGGGAAAARRIGPVGQPPWMAAGQYQPGAGQYDSQFRLGTPTLDRIVGTPDTARTPSSVREHPARRPGLRVDAVRSGGMGMERLALGPGSPASSDSFGSTGSPRRRSSSRGSWAGDDGEGGDSRFEDSLPGGGQLPALWPMGRGVEHSAASGFGTASGLTPSATTSPSATGWRPAPGGLRQQQPHQPQSRMVSGRGGLLGTGWRPARLDTMQDGIADTTWEHHFGGLSTGASASFGHSPGTTTSTAATASMMAANRATLLVGSPRSSQAGRLLARPSSGRSAASTGTTASGGGGGGGGSALPPLVGHRGGMNGMNGAQGTTRCFTSIDSPPGPYERRRVVLTSANQRSQASAGDPATPTVRQYSEGLAGVLTNAQIQEWMSQHASRLLLPRHMHEIADIVFRPPSAAPEKKPPKLHSGNGGAALLSPPVVLGGRYPPPHMTRILLDPAYVTSLLGSLTGVDPVNSRVVAVVTALQGRDVVVAEEGAEEGQQQSLQLLTSSLKRLPGKAPVVGSAPAATAAAGLGATAAAAGTATALHPASARSTVGGP